VRKWWIIWPLYVGLMGFALGASFFFGLYGRNVTEGSITAQHEQQSANETTKSKKEDSDEALAFYTLWLMAFTGVLAFATVGLGIATAFLYATGEKQFKVAIRSSIRQSRDMQASVAAAEKSATAADLSAKAVIVVERASVYPVILGYSEIEDCLRAALESKREDVPVAKTTELAFKFKNFGKTPAILKTAFVAFGAPPHGALTGVAIPESVLAHLEETSPLVSKMQIGLTRKQAQHILVYTGHICFEGEVTFDDIWGNEHMTEFYFVWDKDIKSMSLKGVETKTKQKDS
jgi:hypothetical protein